MVYLYLTQYDTNLQKEIMLPDNVRIRDWRQFYIGPSLFYLEFVD